MVAPSLNNGGIQLGEGVLHLSLGELAGRLHAPAGEHFISVVVVMMMTAAAMTVMVVVMLVLILVVIIVIVVMMMAAAAHTVLIVVMMVMLVLFFLVLVGVLLVCLGSHGDQLGLEVILGGHSLSCDDALMVWSCSSSSSS